MLEQMPMPIFGQTAVTISPQLIPEVRSHHRTPVPCKNNKKKPITKYKLRQTWVVWGQKVLLQNSKSGDILSLTIRPALREGAFGLGAPPRRLMFSQPLSITEVLVISLSELSQCWQRVSSVY
jgi:hypothetical protein